MSEDSSTVMSAASTTASDEIQTTGGNTTTSSSSDQASLYFQFAVVVIGVVGTAANALILYAMVASEEHKKQLLIFNQNAFDLCSSLLLIVTFTVKLCNIRLTGMLGHWLCVIFVSESLLWCSIYGSIINLMSVTIERYLKVVHSSWSNKWLRKWVRCSTAAFAWIAGIVYKMTLAISTTVVIDGKCIPNQISSSAMAAVVHNCLLYTSPSPRDS